MKSTQLKEMMYDKLIPIQISNIYRELNKINIYTKRENINGVKKSYMAAVKLMKSLKKSIDNLDM